MELIFWEELLVPLSHQSEKDTLFKMINNEIICIPCLRLETLKSIGGGGGYTSL